MTHPVRCRATDTESPLVHVIEDGVARSRPHRHERDGPTVAAPLRRQLIEIFEAKALRRLPEEAARPKMEGLGVPYFPMATYDDLGISPVGRFP